MYIMWRENLTWEIILQGVASSGDAIENGAWKGEKN